MIIRHQVYYISSHIFHRHVSRLSINNNYSSSSPFSLPIVSLHLSIHDRSKLHLQVEFCWGHKNICAVHIKRGIMCVYWWISISNFTIMICIRYIRTSRTISHLWWPIYSITTLTSNSCCKSSSGSFFFAINNYLSIAIGNAIRRLINCIDFL